MKILSEPSLAAAGRAAPIASLKGKARELQAAVDPRAVDLSEKAPVERPERAPVKLVQVDMFDSGMGKELKAVRFSKKNGESELLEVLNALLHPVLRVSQELYMGYDCCLPPVRSASSRDHQSSDEVQWHGC